MMTTNVRLGVCLIICLFSIFFLMMTNDDDDQIGVLLGNARFLLGLSDAGAHTSQLCDAGNTTTLLSHWVRERRALPDVRLDLALVRGGDALVGHQHHHRTDF